MSGAMAGPRGAGGGTADAIRLALGHAISMHRVREKLAAFDALSMPRVLAAAKGAWAEAWEYNSGTGTEYFESHEIYGRYAEAHGRKNWGGSDRMFLDMLKTDRVQYSRFLDAEETARAFSVWLCGTSLASDYVYRWINPPELGSCTDGTFESKIEEDGTRRGFKALTINPELRFEGRKIHMRVPMDGGMRSNVRCVHYTVMPRNLEEEDERICDPKEAKHATEAEVRVIDGTPIPPRTDFVVLPGAKIGREVAKGLGRRYKIAWLDS